VAEISETPSVPVQTNDAVAPRSAKPYRWLIKLGLALVVLAIFVWIGRRFFDDLPKLRQAKPLGILLIALIFIPTRLLTSEVMRIGLKALGHVVSVYEAFMVSMVNAYANLLIPRAGLGLPAVYMKMKHGVPIADFSSVQLVPMTVLQITTIGIAGIVCLAVLHLGYGKPWHLPLLAVFAFLAVGSAVAMVLPVSVPLRFQNRLAAFLRRMAESYQRLGRSGHTIAGSMLLHAAVLVLRAVRIYVAFRAMGQDVNFWGVFVGSLLADIGFFISVTPSALGFREGGVLLAAPLIGVTADMAVAATILDRIVYSLVIVVIGQLGMWRLVGPVFKGGRGAAGTAVPS
jgi:uncharacterized protein (TIRG00374 family)